MTFEEHISDLDPRLFEHVTSLASDHDKRSWLACELATAALCPEGYSYLEIGSYLGGSLQTHVADPACKRIVSIDKRVPSDFGNNSIDDMLGALRGVEGADLEKLECIEADSFEISADSLPITPDLCLIDGLHTDEAVVNDFRLCRGAMGENGAVLFHDSQVIYGGIAEIVEGLQASRARFRAYNLPEIVFAIELGDFPMHRHPRVAELLADNHLGYLAVARWSDRHRRSANKWPLPWVRAVKRTIENRRVTTGYN
jgi:methyltransferase family protein